MSSLLFKIYFILTNIFNVGMLLFLVIEPHEISKLFALGLLWCCVGMFFNSQALIKVTNIIERIGGKLGKK